jgi:RNA polymerase sigma-70 factor (ECF subfamily)
MYYRLDGDEGLAEDMASDTFLKAFEKFDTYNDKYAFSTWIYTIARNVLIDYVRKNKVKISGIEEVEDKPSQKITEESLQFSIDKEIDLKKVQSVMETLTDFQKDCIIMKYLNELKTKEISEITGQSEINVRQAISRGMRKLKTKLNLILFLLAIILSNNFKF